MGYGPGLERTSSRMSRDGCAGGVEMAAAAPPDCVGESEPPADPLVNAPRSLWLPLLPPLPPLPLGLGANSKSRDVLWTPEEGRHINTGRENK